VLKRFGDQVRSGVAANATYLPFGTPDEVRVEVRDVAGFGKAGLCL
jgi:hypothetical protein